MRLTTKRAGPLLLALFLSGGYLYAFPSASVLYALIILLHLLAGGAFTILLIPALWRNLREASRQTRLGWTLLAGGALLGLILIFVGARRPYQSLFYTHIALSLAGFLVLVSTRLEARLAKKAFVRLALLLGAVVLCGSAWAVRELRWYSSHQIMNPALPPASMEGEGGGAQSPFFPSSAQTVDGALFPASFFMESQACERCHADIYQQWFSSTHHFSSFNNQWYRKTVEYLQEVAGPQPSKFCAGCHDPALLFSGMMDTPIGEIINRPEAHAGLGCVACHSIVAVKSTMGQGDYLIEYPALHELAANENPLIRSLHDFLVRLNPEPHRRAFLKPFMRQQSARFCSACHKVHLDEPLNLYRWVRGFNEYDHWQDSGVSGQGARSFYYPEEPQTCVDCHMPLVASEDDGNRNGFVHSHRFPGAHTSLPVVNQDDTQLEITRRFLQDDILSVDIFALAQTSSPRHSGPVQGTIPALTPIQAPLGRAEAVVHPGASVRVDVVVRNRKVGHFFPAGTTDAFDVWLELVATNEEGRVLFWSGRVEQNGHGPVEEGAHFYRTVTVDAHSNLINKRNAWASRAVIYNRLLPPGSAEVARFRLFVPPNAGTRITLRARLNYRKFSWWFTHFAYAGERDPGQPNPDVTLHYDDGRWVFTGDTSNVSGQLKHVPDLPIVILAEGEATLQVAPRTSAAPPAQAVLDPADWERWNDYGIGLLLQDDRRNAEAAFEIATQIDPQNPDGWVNLGRVRIREGDLSGARAALEQALAIRPGLARAHFFLAQVERAEGRLQEAYNHLEQAAAQYPRDRRVRSEMGRVLFLQHRYPEAITQFQQVLAIDPEDLQAHYHLMLTYRALGQPERAREHQTRYLRFREDESTQGLIGPYLLEHPEANNERQPIHEHESVPLE